MRLTSSTENPSGANTFRPVWIPDAKPSDPALPHRAHQPCGEHQQQRTAIEELKVVAQLGQPMILQSRSDSCPPGHRGAPDRILRERDHFPSALQEAKQREHREEIRCAQ